MPRIQHQQERDQRKTRTKIKTKDGKTSEESEAEVKFMQSDDSPWNEKEEVDCENISKFKGKKELDRSCLVVAFTEEKRPRSLFMLFQGNSFVMVTTSVSLSLGTLPDAIFKGWEEKVDHLCSSSYSLNNDASQYHQQACYYQPEKDCLEKIKAIKTERKKKQEEKQEKKTAMTNLFGEERKPTGVKKLRNSKFSDTSDS
ncbi:hypothetical protein FQR65_LT11549 [Abscondita terminalis]|nr:hypothetical protein FQR65_LT11549 [Abscondita terminalis]